MQVKKQRLELDMEQQTGSKSGKEYAKAVYCHPAYLTYMQCTSCEKQKTAYEMVVCDWSSDMCSSDLFQIGKGVHQGCI